MLDVLANATARVSHQEYEPAHVADPLADLLLSAAAIIVIAVIAVLPIMPRHSMPQRDLSHGFQNSVVFQVGDRKVDPFIATEQGLIVGRSSSRMIPVDKIFFDEALPGVLEEMRKAKEASLSSSNQMALRRRFNLRQLQAGMARGECARSGSIQNASLQGWIVSRPVATTCFVGCGEGACDFSLA